MSYKTLKLLRLFVVVILGVLVAWSAAKGKAWIPVPAVIGGIMILFLSRRGLKEIIVDERTYSVAHQASRLAFVVFGVGAVTIGATLLALGQGSHPELKPIGFTLAYSVCGLVLIYYIAYIYYNKKYSGKE
jgi:uncharacterized membrane protein